jgi:hypothetical protein
MDNLVVNQEGGSYEEGVLLLAMPGRRLPLVANLSSHSKEASFILVDSSVSLLNVVVDQRKFSSHCANLKVLGVEGIAEFLPINKPLNITVVPSLHRNLYQLR